MDAIQSQLAVRNRCEQAQKTIKELYEWEDQVKRTASKAQFTDNNEHKTIPPVRSDVKTMNKFSEQKTTNAEKQDPTEPETVDKKRLADAETLKERGNKQCKLGNYHEAIELYSQAIETYGDNAVYYSNRALCYMNLEFFDDCLADCNLAIAKDPEYIKAYYRRMQAYERLGENEKAATECRQILQLSKDENDRNTAKRDLARIEKRLKDQKPSAAAKPVPVEVNDTLAMVKAEADKYKELGNKHLARKDYEKAERSYSKAIALFPDEAIYYNNRSLCYWNLKDYDKCLADCNKAIQLDENYFRPYYRRMQVRELLGAYQGAVEDCRKFLELTKDEKQKATAEKDLLRLEKLVRNEQPAKQAFVWSEIKKNAKLIHPIQKPPHLRSKKPLKQVFIKEAGSCPFILDPSAVTPPGQRKVIHDAIIDKIFNNNTGERLIEPEEKTNLEHLFPSHSKLRNMFSPPTTPTEPRKLVPAKSAATSAVVPNKTANTTGPNTRITAEQKPQNKVEKNKINLGSQDATEKAPQKAPLPDTQLPRQLPTIPAIPKTSSQFYTTWSELNEDARYQCLKLLRSAPLNKLFGASLSNKMLSELLQILQKRFIPDREEVTYILQEIIRNDSTAILSMMMNKTDRDAITELLKYMKASNAKPEDVEAIRQKLLN